jgi:phage protein D
MLNPVPVKSSLRQPRAIVRAFAPGDAALAAALSDGPTAMLVQTAVSGWTEWTVSNNSYFEADTFSVTFAVSALPASNDADWFSEQPEIFVEILAGFPSNPSKVIANELTSLIYGRVDTLDFDPTATAITLTGRDLTAAFIDKKGTDQYQNQKAFQIVEQLAQSHGLSCLATVTKKMVGVLANDQWVLMQTSLSEWDLIARLARDEGFVVYIQGDSMYFGPDGRAGSEPYLIKWTPATDSQASPVANVRNLSFSRAMTVAKGITVTVRSAQHFKKAAVVRSYPSAPKAIQAGKASPFGNVQTYYYNVESDLTPERVENRAEQLYNQIVQHARKLSAELPGDLLMNVSTPLTVTGTGTAFDQTYFPRLITRSMSASEGFTMSVEALATTPAEEQAAGDS